MARIVAIDLGRFAAKAVVYETSGRTAGLEGYYSKPVYDDGEGRSPSLGARLAALDVLLQTHHTWQAPSTLVALSWPTDDVSTRIVSLPFADKTQVEQTLPFTVEELVPFDMDDMLLGWRQLPSPDGGTRAHVTLVRIEQLRSVLEALQSRNVDPGRVVVDGEAVGALVPGDAGVAIVDVGHASTTISILHGGHVLSERAIDVAGRRFTQAIAAAMDLSFSEAQAVKHGEHPPDEEPTEGGQDRDLDPLTADARTALDSVFGLLLAEVRSTLLASEDQHGMEIDRVLLTGGGARIEPLSDYLERDLGVSVEWLAEPDGTIIPPEFGVARGLARLGAVGGSAVNLRTGPLAFKGGVNVLRAVVTYGLAGVAFFLVAATVVFAVQYVRLTSEQTRVDEQIQSIVLQDFPDTDPDLLLVGSDAAALMEGNVLRMEDRADVLAGEGRIPPITDLMYRIHQARPDPDDVRVDVDEMTITQQIITLTADTDDYSAAAAFETAIQAAPGFSEAVKGEDRKTRDTVQFTMTIPLALGDADGDLP